MFSVVLGYEFAFIVNYINGLLTIPWRSARLEKLIVLQLKKQFPTYFMYIRVGYFPRDRLTRPTISSTSVNRMSEGGEMWDL
jgi:hypothetical protein